MSVKKRVRKIALPNIRELLLWAREWLAESKNMHKEDSQSKNKLENPAKVMLIRQQSQRTFDEQSQDASSRAKG